jgi:hypothetical protein
MLRYPNLIGAALFGVAIATTALGQAPATPPPSPPASAPHDAGVGPQTTHPAQVDKGQNMILPSAGSSGPSAAPTMVFDCKAKPEDCTTPATPADKTTGPAISAPPAKAP